MHPFKTIVKRRVVAVNLLLLLTLSLTFATPLERHKLPLQSATVYLQGAELFHTGKVSIPQGESTLILTDIADDIDPDSLFITTNSPLLIKSYRVERDFLNELDRPKKDTLLLRLEAIEAEQEEIAVKKMVLERRITALDKNLALGGKEKSIAVDEIEALLDFVTRSMNDALEEQLTLTRNHRELEKEREKIERQLNEGQSSLEQSPVSNVVVEVVAEQALETTVNLSYIVRQAQWRPTYDIYVEKKDAPIMIHYKASLQQSSGLDWDNVMLTFSTSEIKTRITDLTLHPQWISLVPDQQKALARSKASLQEASSSVLYGSVRYDYQDNQVLDHVAFDVGGLDSTYRISIPYSVPADGLTHQIALKNEKAEGKYSYIAVPLIQESIFLRVDLDEWESLSLLPGRANLYFDNRYLGEAEITLENIYHEDFSFLLGEDKQLSITREDLGRFQSKPSFFGNNVTRDYSYAINLHNSRDEAVTVTVVDQIPVSTDEALEVINLKYDRNAILEEKSGELRWNITIEPSKTVKLPFSYSTKTTKDREIEGL